MINSAMFTSNTNEWATPQAFFDELNKEFAFTLDPCATPENAKCARFFTKEIDGLAQSWRGETVFCNPPPNPAKLTDSRCGKYIREYGYESWELDALEPSVLDNLISETILCYLDKPLYDSMARKEDKIKDELLTYARAFRTD